LLISIFNRPKLAWELSAMALELNERFGNKGLRGTLLHLHGDHFNYFGQPLASNFPYLDRGFIACQEVGDLVHAGFIAFEIVWWFIERGDPLQNVIAQAQRYASFARESSNTVISQVIEMELQFVACLQGKTRSLSSLDGHGFDAAAFNASLTQAGFGTGPAFLHILEQMLHYLAGHYHESLRASRSAREVIGAVSAMPLEVHHHVFQALAAAALYAGAAADDRQNYRDMVERAERRLAILAAHCPANFADRHVLVQAELTRLDGDLPAALRAYEQSAQAARAQGFIHMEALAHLVAGRCYLTHDLDTAATACLAAAHQCYQTWGAHGVVRELERRYPRLVAGAQPDGKASAASTAAFDLDVQTIIKATRAISSEIQIDTLSERLLAIATESAGADHGYLVLDIDKERRIIDMSAKSRPLDEVTDIARTVIDDVMLSGQVVLLHDAVHDHVYGSDPHIARCSVKSLLCLPIELKGAVTGALYLENRLIASSFTPERMSVLEVVATQAAISLENAALYQDMEQRVVDRTHELKEAQHQLMLTAHQAGMAEIASSVLHNVGNILNSLNVSANVLDDELRGLRLPLLDRAVTLMEDNRSDLARFLTEDGKGRQLPALLRGLCDHLLGTEKNLSVELKRMEQHIHHLDAIVHMQQRYADPSQRFLEECTIRDLVEDALGFSATALTQYKIAIERHYHDTRSCLIDKHRVLQILVNLIANAKHAMLAMPLEHPRVLTMEVTQDEARTMVAISDTGKGITPEELPELFKFGFTTRPEGHGLGLHSSAINAQALDGSIGVHSEGAGKGARFTLTIPLQPSRSAASQDHSGGKTAG
jgi:signal transduction histidine kinase